MRHAMIVPALLVAIFAIGGCGNDPADPQKVPVGACDPNGNCGAGNRANLSLEDQLTCYCLCDVGFNDEQCAGIPKPDMTLYQYPDFATTPPDMTMPKPDMSHSCNAWYNGSVNSCLGLANDTAVHKCLELNGAQYFHDVWEDYLGFWNSPMYEMIRCYADIPNNFGCRHVIQQGGGPYNAWDVIEANVQRPGGGQRYDDVAIWPNSVNRFGGPMPDGGVGQGGCLFLLDRDTNGGKCNKLFNLCIAN